MQERVAATRARFGDGLVPMLEEQLTDWPTEVESQIDLTGETAVESGEIPDGELILYVHGFLGQGRFDVAKMSGAHQAAALQEALELEYESRTRKSPTVVAGMWDSSTTWPRAKRRSTHASETLADWLRAQGQRSVHLVGHSLGGRVSLETLDNGPGSCIESVALLGAAVDPDSVCHQYRPGIEAVDGPVFNYHSENDGMVCRLYRVGEFSAGLGCRGSDCRGGLLRSSGRLPSNYTDVDVSEQVTRHLDYYKPAEYTASGNCVGELVDNQF
ncbi:DUF726 domain-containing protein [Halovenus sp. HT40]|uniref:DUF726 domain-containing protein n=1 Tax=Halovenus sp. HT40 TaxID=3126691 RepID=UPI00300F1004